MSRNYSGFSGYNVASLYPDYGNRVSSLMETVVDPEEQQALSAQEPDAKAARPANPTTKNGVLLVFVVLILGIFVFGWKL